MRFRAGRLRAETRREGVLVLLIVLVLVGFSLIIQNYLSARLFNRVSASVTILAILAIGQTLVVLTRNIDLSVGSVVGFTAYFVGQQLSLANDIPPLVAVAMCVGIGAGLGACNGAIVAWCRVPAIIVTLGTLAIFRTVLVEFSDAQTILTVNLPQWLVDLPRLNVVSFGRLHLRVVVVVMLGVAVFFQLLLKYSSFGRRLYAIGSNPEAAHHAGFPTRGLVFTAFTLCGALAGLAGFLFLARFGNITVVAGLGLELKSVAAVVVGGVNIFGGAGSVLGAVLGAILIDLLENSLIRSLQVSEFLRDALLGLLILVSVAVDSLLMKRRRSS